jgi:hypothetical protein
LKEFEEDTRSQKDLPCSWIGRINIIEMTILMKAIYMLNTKSITVPRSFFTEIEKSILNSCGSIKDPI